MKALAILPILLQLMFASVAFAADEAEQLSPDPPAPEAIEGEAVTLGGGERERGFWGWVGSASTSAGDTDERSDAWVCSAGASFRCGR